MLTLDRRTQELYRASGYRFEPVTRTWTSAGRPPAGEGVSPQEAVVWLQRESAHPCRVPVGVIGPREATVEQRALAEGMGAILGELGLYVVCGGREGVMEACCRGVASRGGISVGLLPEDTPEAANPHVTLILPTGIGIARNAVLARAALCLVAVGGGLGTLSEIALGLQFGKVVFGLAGAPEVAGVRSMTDPGGVAEQVARVVLGLPLE